jgi:hypothetical protein
VFARTRANTRELAAVDKQKTQPIRVGFRVLGGGVAARIKPLLELRKTEVAASKQPIQIAAKTGIDRVNLHVLQLGF